MIGPIALRLRNRRTLGAICWLLVAGTLFAGLWPFNPSPRNDVSWLQNQNGIRFGPAGIVFSPKTFLWPPSSTGTSTFTLELFIQPANDRGTNDILSFYSADAPQWLRLFQWRGTTLLLYRNYRSSHREIDIENAFQMGIPVLLTIVARAQDTAVYLDGTLVTVSQLRLSQSDLVGRIILGTSPVSNTTWTGNLLGMAIYNHDLTEHEVKQHFDTWKKGKQPEALTYPVALYTFGEGSGRVIHSQSNAGPDLYIPESFQIPYKPLLLAPWHDPRWDSSKDVAVNVVGFIPVGLVFCAYLSARRDQKRAMICAFFLCGILSLVIECVQVYLPTRTSSLTDVLTNMLGGLLGILLSRSKIVGYFCKYLSP